MAAVSVDLIEKLARWRVGKEHLARNHLEERVKGRFQSVLTKGMAPAGSGIGDGSDGRLN